MKKSTGHFIFIFIILSFLPIPTIGDININQINEKYHTMLVEKGIEITLKIIGNHYLSDEITSDECHILLHEVGEYASLKYGLNDSLKQATDSIELCRSGFIHGLFLGTDITQINNTAICTKNSFKNSALKLNCLHGLGHGLAVSFDYNLSPAIKICKSAETKEYQSACATGIFMEEFSPRAHFSSNATKETFSICEKTEFKAECYWYVGIRIIQSNTLSEGINECHKVNINHQRDCYRGFGVLTARKMNYEANAIFSICKNLKECLFGAASEFGQSTEISKSLSFCNQLLWQQKSRCFLEMIYSYSKHLY